MAVKIKFTIPNLFPPVDLEDIYARKESFEYGTLWTWGNNFDGNLGDNTRTDRSSPVQTVAYGQNWFKLGKGGVGGPHSGAIKTDGILWMWGDNSRGAVGDNTLTDKSSPVQIGITGADRYWVSLSLGGHNIGGTFGLKNDGTLWAWGRAGSVGDNNSTDRSSPVQMSGTWKHVSGGGYMTAAIKLDGTLWMWGGNSYGQLGDNTTTVRLVPVQTVAGGTNWKYVSCGAFNVAAIKTDGTLWAWGKNSFGEVGDNTRTNRSSPVQTVAGGSDWKTVACGGRYTMALKTDGTRWAWGLNNGQLGLGDYTMRSSPTQAGNTKWIKISAGYQHCAGIRADRTLWLWGINGNGQLGNGTSGASINSPVQTLIADNKWLDVECSGNAGHTYAIRST